ncbi:hypothetical protein FACS1894172_06790 [Spirochaetia bacterium]|nr:hypothetical protein FACS1894172_06790 [Spirochaetia bacterium]
MSIQEKLTENPNIADIIHGVVYCISYERDRIEDFEIEFIKKIFNRGYKVVIAFTQADNSGYEKKKLVYRKVLSEKLGEKFKEASVTVDVSAVPTKKLSQKEAISAFGKDELLSWIEKNIDLNIKRVSLYIWQKWKNESLQKVEDEKADLLNRINRFYDYDAEDFFWRITTIIALTETLTNTIRARELRDLIARSLEDLQNEVFGNIQNDTSSNFTDGSVATGLASALLKIVPIIGLFQIALEEGILQDELKTILNKNIEAIENAITTQYANASSLLLNGEKE